MATHAPRTIHPYGHLLDAFPSGVVISDADTRILYANETVREILKLTDRDLTDSFLYERVHPEDRKKVRSYAQILKTQKHTITKRRFRVENDSYIILERNTSLLSDGTQLSICRDVTQEEAERSHMERFISLASHELRNPLSSIQLGADALAEMLKGAATREQLLTQLDDMRDQIRAESRLIDDLLDISKIKKGTLPFRDEPVNLAALIATVARHIGALTSRSYLITELTPITGFVRGDKDRLYQAFFNLLHNAAKYSEAPAPILITLEEKDGVHGISITDYGIGIRAADQTRIFDDYYRVNTDSVSGLGLGLFLAREIIQHHRGTLGVRSELGSGSTFLMTLPVDEMPEGKRVLIVDDTEAIADAIGRLLQLHEYEVEVAYSGDAALRAVETFRPDAILLDVEMPGMSGYDVAHALRAKGWSGLIVGISGYSMKSDRARSQEAGFDHYLIKPVSSQDILSILRRKTPSS
jgi:PAS domain S-box-containing protein